MKILVTGGAGFIGSNIVDRYIADGHRVVIVDNLSTGKECNLNPSARFYKVGIEENALDEIFKKEEPDLVNHHAAQIDLRRSVEDPIFDAKVNILDSLNLFQQCVKCKVKKIIFASSGGAGYGEQSEFPASEEHALKPLSPYGIAKVSVEMYLYFYMKTHGIDYTVLRYANVYGPRQDPLGEAGVVAIFINAMLNNKSCIINGDGKQTRDYIYIDDVVNANILALNKGAQEVFNIGTGIETDVNELAERLKKETGSSVELKHGIAKLGEQKRSAIDPQKAIKELNWKPAISIDEGIKKTINWYRRPAL